MNLFTGQAITNLNTWSKSLLGIAKFIAIYKVVNRFASLENRELVNISLDFDKAWAENGPKHILEANSEWHMVEKVDTNKL